LAHQQLPGCRRGSGEAADRGGHGGGATGRDGPAGDGARPEEGVRRGATGGGGRDGPEGDGARGGMLAGDGARRGTRRADGRGGEAVGRGGHCGW
jgi:hypothetical protein